MKIGILGGSFDPVHYGHIEMARYCKEKFNLDKIMFLPLGQAWHKKISADRETRFEMLEKAISSEKDFYVSRIELDREGTTYTVDTLRQLDNKNEYYYIIGGDTLDSLHTWKDANEVFKLTKFIVIERKNAHTKRSIAEEMGANVIFTDHTGLNISSTEIRKKVAEHEDISKIVPEEVKRIIEENGLYSN